MKQQRAVVIGSGIAGLLAANALADHYASVTVLDKDPNIGSASPRPGAVQGAHLHVLLKRGQEILFSLFPTIEAELQNFGCAIIDWAQDTEWENRMGRFPMYESNIKTLSMSRPLLEKLIYSKIKMKTNVYFHNNTIENFVTINGRVTAVQTRAGESFPVDFLAIAAGHHFPVQKYFPFVDIVAKTRSTPIGITYRSQIFETKSLTFTQSKQYYYQLSPPEDTLGAVICPIENNLSIATIIQYGSNEIKKMSADDFFQLAKKIPGDRFSKIIQNGSASSSVAIFQKSTMHIRPFHKMKGLPNNLIVMGDIFCSLNPVFGQGMTVALEQSLILKDLLMKNSLCPVQFHKLSYKVARLPYSLSKIGSNVKNSFSKRYLHRFLVRCQKSKVLHQRFLNVLHLRASFLTLFDLRSLVSIGGSSD
jgi:2-polyprenyl-6-methoxyphenol hydroxylase-like FAD-dependent oxidoreductase